MICFVVSVSVILFWNISLLQIMHTAAHLIQIKKYSSVYMLWIVQFFQQLFFTAAILGFNSLFRRKNLVNSVNTWISNTSELNTIYSQSTVHTAKSFSFLFEVELICVCCLVNGVQDIVTSTHLLDYTASHTRRPNRNVWSCFKICHKVVRVFGNETVQTSTVGFFLPCHV